MGTHPIFESDFDCLTDWSETLFSSRRKNTFTLTPKMRSKYVQRKTAEIEQRDKQRKLKQARRTAFNEIPDSQQDKNATASTWASVNDDTIMSTRSSNRCVEPTTTTTKQKEPVLTKKRPKSNDWSIRSESHENEKENVDEERDTLDKNEQKAIKLLEDLEAKKAAKKKRNE